MAAPVHSQELVVHVFVHAERPHVDEANRWIREVWSACRRELGMTGPVRNLGLPTALPGQLADLSRTQIVAAQEGPSGQVLLRREGAVLNLSAVLMTPPGAGIAGWKEAGWKELDQRWTQVTSDVPGALVGQVRLHLGLLPAGGDRELDDDDIVALAGSLRPLLPPSRQAGQWEDRGLVVTGKMVLWELAPQQDTRAERHFLVAAVDSHDAELSDWTWSNGHPALPPLARYLMHAANLRYQVRVWDEGKKIGELRGRVDGCLARLRKVLADIGSEGSRVHAADVMSELATLRAERGDLVLTSSALQDMRNTVESITSRMIATLGRPYPDVCEGHPFRDDRQLADWFARQLDIDIKYLASTQDKADRLDAIAAAAAQELPARPDRSHGPRNPLEQGLRMGFAVDVVGYAKRSVPARSVIQERLWKFALTLVENMGAVVAETHIEKAGDGIIVFLLLGNPAQLLPALLRLAPDLLAADNATYQDQVRIRMSVGVGMFGPGATGVNGPLVVELARLESSAPLREAAAEHRESDLVVLVSRRLHEDVINPGYLDHQIRDFRRVEVTEKELRQSAWLWIAPPAGSAG